MSSDAFDREQPSQPPPDEDWPARIEVLLAEAEATPAGAERTGALCQVAEIYDRRLADPNGALVTLQAALADDPGSGRVIQEMERIARGHGLWGELANVTAEVAGAIGDRKLAADLWVQIAFWNETGRAQLDAATVAAETALALEPAHGGALALLENLHRRLRSWDRYVEILGRRAQAGADPARLTDGYREVLRYEPRHLAALEALAGVQEDAGEWESAAGLRERLVAALPSPSPEAIAARYRLARLLKERLGDPRAAEGQLALALALPGGDVDVPSLLLLAAIYRERKDWLKARQLLGRAAALVAENGERARILAEAADICATALDDETQAADLYAEIIALDATRADLIEKLAEIKQRRGDFTGLLPLAEALAAAVEDKPAADKARALHRLGRARAATGDDAGALESYRAAVAAAPAGEARGALADLGELAFRLEAWGESAGALDALLAEPAELPREAQATAYERLGLARLRAGAPAAALEPLEKALTIDPQRNRALEALVQAAHEAGNDDTVVRHTQALLAITEDPKTKLALLERVAVIHRDRRNDPQRAIAAYLEALQIWPDERAIMHRLLELYSDTKQWKQAVQLLARLAAATDGTLRAPYLVAAGNILIEELATPAEAVEALEQALDADPRDRAIFDRVDGIVAASRDWKTQERLYRRQIKRLGTEVPPDERPVLLALWQGLGDIYLTKLKDGPAAIAALEVAQGLDPDSTERLRVLAELYRLAGSEHYAKAIAAHRTLIFHARTAAETESDLKALVRLFVDTGALEEAYAAAAALVLMGRADADERALHHQYRPAGVVRAHAQLNEDLWQRQIFHPEQDRLLSQILGTLAPVVSALRARPFKDLPLKKKQRRELASDPALPCKVLAYAAGVLGLAPPDVYALPEAPGEVDVVNIRGTNGSLPALVLGRGIMEGRSDLELAFVAGRVLAALRADHLLRWPAFVPTLAELEIVVRAAIRVVAPSAEPPGGDEAGVAQYAAFLDGNLSPQPREQLSHLIRRFLTAAGPQPELGLAVGRWSRAACFTTIRAGLLICGDLEIAARLGQAAAAPAGIDAGDIVRDLTGWSVSESYFALRAQLGLRAVNLGFRG